MDRSSNWNISRDNRALSNPRDQIDWTDIFITSHPKETKYTFLSNVHGTLLNTDHMIGPRTNLNKFKKIEIISRIFLDHKGFKLADLKEKFQKHSNSWRLNSMLLNNEWVRMRSKNKSKSFWKQMKMNTQQPKMYGTQRRQSWQRSSLQYKPTLKT